MKQKEITYKTPEYPNQIRLDTTTACNARCLSCHRFVSHRKGTMSINQISAILEDIAKWSSPLKEIVPVNYGEFFLRADWQTILSTISFKLPQTRIVIPTNGSLLDIDKVNDLCKIPGVKVINFSVNAFFDETYEVFTGLPSSTIENIEKAIRLIRLYRPDIILWVSMVFDPMYQSDFERDKFMKRWEPLVHRVWILSASSAHRPEKSPVINHVIPCRSIFSDMVIGYDGKLSSCCWDAAFSLDLGFYSGDARADWHNDKMEGLRNLHNEHRRNDIPLCKECTSA